jgi:hypothetical protein
MATITKVLTKTISNPPIAWHILWETLTTTNADGDPVEMPGHSDRSVQVVGTFGSGGTVDIEGSNDGSTWAILTDPQGNALSFTAAGLEAVAELTRYIRPNVSAGDGTSDLDVHMIISGVRDQ